MASSGKLHKVSLLQDGRVAGAANTCGRLPTLGSGRRNRALRHRLAAAPQGGGVHKQEISGSGGRPVQLDIDASTARARIEARLGAIASRRAAALPAPAERPIPLQRVGDVYSAVPARPYPTAGGRE